MSKEPEPEEEFSSFDDLHAAKEPGEAFFKLIKAEKKSAQKIMSETLKSSNFLKKISLKRYSCLGKVA